MISPPEFETEEQYIRWQLSEIQRAYQKQAEPLIKRLCFLEALKPPPPIYLTAEDAAKMRASGALKFLEREIRNAPETI